MTKPTDSKTLNEFYSAGNVAEAKKELSETGVKVYDAVVVSAAGGDGYREKMALEQLLEQSVNVGEFMDSRWWNSPCDCQAKSSCTAAEGYY